MNWRDESKLFACHRGSGTGMRNPRVSWTEIVREALSDKQGPGQTRIHRRILQNPSHHQGFLGTACLDRTGAVLQQSDVSGKRNAPAQNKTLFREVVLGLATKRNRTARDAAPDQAGRRSRSVAGYVLFVAPLSFRSRLPWRRKSIEPGPIDPRAYLTFMSPQPQAWGIRGAHTRNDRHSARVVFAFFGGRHGETQSRASLSQFATRPDCDINDPRQ